VSDSVLDNAQHAEEARTIAEKLSDPQSTLDAHDGLRS